MDDEVRELERLAEADHRAAISYGETLTELADPSLQARAHRALGNAHRALARLEAAFDHYERGIDVASAAGLEDLEGLTRMSRAGASSMAGDVAAALQDLTKAEALTTGMSQARVLFQRAAVVQRSSEGVDALEAYNTVVPLLAEHGDHVFLAHALSNRGVIHLYQGDQEAAKLDLEAALELYESQGMGSPAAVVVHNLGLVHTRMSDIPAALASFDEAERRLIELGRPIAGLHIDRAETLLSAGLTDDAIALAESTVAYLRQRGLHTDLAEALLILAHSALIAGRADASELAAQAAVAFEEQARPGWRDRAHVMRLEAALVTAKTTSSDERYAGLLAGRLGRAGQRGAASRAALVQGLLALEQGRVRAASNCLDRGQFSRRSGLIEERLAYWSLAASVRLADGDRQGALAAARAGLANLNAFRAHIAAPDARAGAAVHAERLINTGLKAASQSRSARTLFSWFERTAAVYQAAPGDTDEDARGELTTLTEQLRTVVRELNETADDERQHQTLIVRQQRIEREIQRASRRRRGNGASAFSDGHLRNAIDAASPRTVLAYTDIDGTTVRCELRNGRFRSQAVGPTAEIEVAVRRTGSLFRRLAAKPDARVAARLDTTLTELSETLLQGLSVTDRDLVILPRGHLALVPWASLPGAHDATVSVAFSLCSWVQMQRSTTTRRTGTAIVVGPGLANGSKEAASIAKTIGDATVIDTESATAEAAMHALRSARTVHFICHGVFRADNPLFSHLEMADGPLMVYDLFDMGGDPAENVVLSSCSGAEMSTRPERAFIGMAGALLAAGVKSLVASVAPVQDASATSRLMTSFHARVEEGQSVRQALAASRNEFSEPSERLLAGSFVPLGVG